MFFQNVFATEYFVSVSGDDKNNGLTEKTAWRTITYAATKAVAGDTVWIKAGDYGTEYVVVRNSGTQGKPILFIGYKNSTGDITSLYFTYSPGKSLNSVEMPLLDGKNRGQGTGFNMKGKSYIHIKNLQITNYKELLGATGSNNSLIERLIAANAGVSDATAVNFDGSGNHHNVLRNCIVMNATDRAIAMGGNNNLVENCKTYADQDDIGSDGRSMDYHVFLTGSNNIIRGHYAEHVGNLKHTGHGLVLKGNGIPTENNLIEDCDVVNINGSIEFRHRSVKNNTARNIRIRGINSSAPGGFHFRDGAGFNIVENCTVKNIKGSNGTISFYDSVEDGGTQWAGNDNIIRNCIFENSDLGIKIGSSSTQTYSTIYNNKILNCTFINIKDLCRIYTTSTNKNNVIENSIISNVKNLYFNNYNSPGWTQGYNNYFNNGFEKPAGTGNISSDPLFEDQVKGNYRLKSTSKLIDAGKNVESVKTDYDGKKRPSGSSHDIGAYEYQGGGTGNTIKADAGKDQNICAGSSAILTASGGSSYKWSTGATSKSITVNPTSTTTYSVTVSDGANSGTDEVIVTVNALPVAKAGADVTIEAGQSTTLSASGGDTYLWSTGETTASITVKPASSTIYEVKVNKNGCESSDSVKVTVNSTSVGTGIVADAGKDVSICSGSSAVLTASGGSVYTWSNGSSGNTLIVSPDKTTTYTVTVSDGVNTATDDVIVTVHTLPVANAGADVSVEEGQSTTLTASGGDTYLWSTGETTESITVKPDSSTNYEVTVTSGGCSSTDIVTVSVNASAPPANNIAADAGRDIVICKGNSAVLTASGGTSYIWSKGEKTKSIVVSPEKTTTYSVTVFDGSGSDTADVTVYVTDLPVANAGNDITIESGDRAVLTASGGDNYTWSTGETTKEITVSPLATTTYEVIVGKNGCESTDKVQVTVKEVPPAAANAGFDITICKGESIILKGDGGATYSWSNGASAQDITVSPTRTTTYTLTTNRGGTTSSDEVIVTVINCDLNNGVNNSVSNAPGNTEASNPSDQDDELVLNKADFEFTVYPNPTEGKLNVQTNIPIYNFNLVLMNINGNVIYSDEMDATEDGINKEIDLSGFAKGVYLLQLYNAEESYVKKVMVI